MLTKFRSAAVRQVALTIVLSAMAHRLCRER